jgi:probable F420-dependent oxidoreductase
MRFSYAESMVDPAYYVPLAQAAEEAGYDSFVVPDSICYPRESSSRYPFSPDGSRDFLEGKPFIDPFVLIGALSAVTSRIRFVTFVLKLPVRHPLLVAKQAASAAVLSRGRLLLGVGSSPWPEDYAMCGVPWAGRARRMDEAIEILRGYLSGGYFDYHGEVFDLPAARIDPVPAEPVSMLVGGHSKGALRRAARVGDGWLHGGGDPDELPVLIGRLYAMMEGRPREGFEIHAISPDAYSLEGIARLEEMGVTDVIVGFRWPYQRKADAQPLSEKIDVLRRYAEEVIEPYRSEPQGPPTNPRVLGSGT